LLGTCSACRFEISSLYFLILWLCCGVGSGGASIVLMRRPSRSIRRWSRDGRPKSGLWPFDSDELVLEPIFYQSVFVKFTFTNIYKFKKEQMEMSKFLAFLLLYNVNNCVHFFRVKFLFLNPKV
jgi:hypothetical protein